MNIFKAAAHGVLAADGRRAQSQLRVQRAEQRRKGLTPTLGLAAELLKILLEGQVNILKFCARRHKLADRLDHSKICAVIGAHFAHIGVITPGHRRAGVRMLFLNGHFVHHRLNGRKLIFSAERHQHGAGADGGVKALRQALSGADVQVAGQRLHTGYKIFGDRLFRHLRCGNFNRNMLFRAVGAQEFAGDIHNGLAAPMHHEPRRFGNLGHDRGFQVLTFGERKEALCILARNHNRHALLRFADGDFRSVQALILLRHRIEVNAQSVSQLTDGNADAAGAKVVAALDEARGLAVAEQALDFSLLRRVALLHLGPAALQRADVVGLRGTGCAAAAVTSRAAAEQDHNVTRRGALTAHILLRRCRNHGTDFHALCQIAVMVKLVHHTRGQADLVTVRGIAACRRGDDLLLRQLAAERILNRPQRIRRARHAHRGIDISSAGKWIADRAAHAGRRAAEGLDFRGMVVRFILKQQQPLLVAGLRLDVDFHRAGVDLFRFVKILHLASGRQASCRDRANVHQIDGLRAADLLARCQIALIGLLKQLVSISRCQSS